MNNATTATGFPVSSLFRSQVEDAEALIDYALRSSHTLRKEIVSKVIAARAAVDAAQGAAAGPAQIDAAVAADFHAAFSELSVLLRTSTADNDGRFVTPDSIRLSRRLRLRDRFWIMIPTVFALFSFVAIILFQSWWLAGTTSVGELVRIETALKQTAAGSDCTVQASVSRPVVELCSARTAHQKILFGLVDLIPKILVLGAVDEGGGGSAGEGEELLAQKSRNGDVVTRQNAETALAVLSTFFLPAFYGLLGASLYVLRKAFGQLALKTLTPSYIIVLNVRLLLGAAAGPLFGLLVQKEVTDSLFAQISPFAIALVVGYSVDIFFAALDRLVAAAKPASKP